MHNTRLSRVGQKIQQEIALIIQQELKDPGLGFITITRIELSKDLRHARVFFSCLGTAAERARSQEALDRSAGYIYGLVKRRMRLKTIPEFTFVYDESIAGAITITDALDKLKES